LTEFLNPLDPFGHSDSTERSESPLSRVLLLTCPEKPPVLDASLALASQGIHHWIEFSDGQYAVTVFPEDAKEAAAQLSLWEEENRGYVLSTDSTPDWEWQLGPLVHLAWPLGVWFFGQTQSIGPWIKQRGLADADLILKGEVWRTLTATTLHADNQHLLGNLLSGYFVLTLLGRRLGVGQSLLLLTLAAAATNVSVAYLSPGHRSLGYSTVVFAGLGMMSGLETLLKKRPFEGWRRMSPLIAAFFLAVMTGLGENSDIKAHFIGFFMGVGFSPLARVTRRLTFGLFWQLIGTLSAYALIALSWGLALGFL
jgi:membrane associated rhomboid family serine protease